jgi:hypothetical protein
MSTPVFNNRYLTCLKNLNLPYRRIMKKIVIALPFNPFMFIYILRVEVEMNMRYIKEYVLEML